jgi:hypothetical protein
MGGQRAWACPRLAFANTRIQTGKGDVCTEKSPEPFLSFPDGTLFTLNRFTITVTAHVLNGIDNLAQSLLIAPRYSPKPADANFLAGTPPPNAKLSEGLPFPSNRNFGVEGSSRGQHRTNRVRTVGSFASSSPSGRIG